ncbi:c-type cytochrome [Effusibacillus dendaii]|uniref:Cytochrome c domain-containing protein n=1 Tax=Effusibacillus dendaii TaxID=2743772 RepID=A0A7I8DGY5_9BACL|nr:c-type cytochrome [Effusibacillus dendaii]BCJ88269.1 hypothetical protein skT53_32540 [Effusibacillus dendaii]
MKTPKWKKRVWTGIVLAGVVIVAAACSADKPVASNTPAETPKETKATQPKVPSMNDVPQGPEGEAIKLGYKLMNETNTALKEYVGNQMACSSCHGTGGTDSTASLVGVTAVYPKYISRAGKVLTIEDRINGCFQRSMNGKPLPYDSDQMRAMVAYLSYISQGVPTGVKERPWAPEINMKNPPKANAADGEKLYKQACAACHGANGEGTGPLSGPPLWGKDSFNIGAGMGRQWKAAAFIQRNMPLGEMGGIKQGTLTDQQAADLAAYILSQERPDFSLKANDWPNGDAPADVPYETKAKQAKAGQ